MRRGPVTRIKFGTDGWRAAIAEDYTFHNVRRCARGVAEYLQQTGTADRGVVVCHDRRFASEHFARACIEVLAAHDIRAFTPPDAVPDPGRQLLHARAGGGRRGSSSPPATTRGRTTASRSRPIPAAPPRRRCWPPSRPRWTPIPEDELPPRREYDDAVGGRPGRDLRRLPALPRSAREHRRPRAHPRGRPARAGREPVRLRRRLVHRASSATAG